MKLERLPEYVTIAVVLTLGLLFAVVAGSMAGAGQVSMIFAVVLGAMAVGVAISLRERIWILLPVLWALSGSLVFLPIPLSIKDMGVLYLFGAYLVMRALKVIRGRIRFDFIDIWMLVLVTWLAVAYFRNPVGTYAMGSDRVGGRPYFDVFIGILAYLILSHAVLPKQWQPRAPLIFALGNLFSSFIGTLTFMVPSTAIVIGKVYSGVNMLGLQTENMQAQNEVAADRQAHLTPAGRDLIYVLGSYFRPLTLITPFYFWRFIATLVVLFVVMKAGSRSLLLEAALFMLVATYFRRGFGEAIGAVAIGVPLLAMVILLHGHLYTLPFSAQRALSILPGKWDDHAVQDARHSSEWRFEMWRNVLTTDGYINDRWLGDGFGFTRREFEIMRRIEDLKMADHAGSQESMMRAGMFHSGPLSTVRNVGLVGLVIYLVLMFLMARMAVRLIEKSRGTPLFPLALFVGVPWIYKIVIFVLVFGAFETALPEALLALGFFKMIQNTHRADEPVKDLVLDPAPVARARRQRRFGAAMIKPTLPTTGHLR